MSLKYSKEQDAQEHLKRGKGREEGSKQIIISTPYIFQERKGDCNWQGMERGEITAMATCTKNKMWELEGDQVVEVGFPGSVREDNRVEDDHSAFYTCVKLS